MKIYILADMEGISGIRMMEQVKSESREYAAGCALMMQEINVAVDAVFAAGATEVVACDTHGGGGQVSIAQMDERAVYETPNRGCMMPSLDESFDAVILLGHHARAGTLNGFLDHTMSSASWFEYRINDLVVGEIGIEAAYAGHFNVPVVAVTGDEATCREAKELLPKVECAVVKWGIGRNRAKCLSLPVAHQIARETLHRALNSIADHKAYQPSLPATIELTYYRSDMADSVAAGTGVKRIGARTVQKTVNTLAEIKGW